MADKKVAVILTGDSSGAVRSIKLTQEELDKLGKKSKETESSIADYAKKAASSFGSVAVSVAKYGAAAGLAAAGIAGALVKSSIDAADATNILAGKLGITTESLSKLQYAAKLADVEQASLESGLKKLSRTLVDAADPASAAAKAFSAIGLSAAEIIKLPADVQLQKIADALGQVENASERSARAQEIFGRSGADLLPLLNEGSGAIKAYGDELERLGGVIDSDFAQKAAQFNDNLDRMKTAVQGVGFALAEEAIQPMEDFTNEIVRLAQDPESIEAIVEGIKNIGLAAKVTGQILAGLAGDLKDLFTRDLEEVQTEIINVSQMLESLQKIEQRGGTVDAREKQRWQDKLDALQKERAELKMLVIERKFDNVESGNSVTAARKEAASRKETTGAIKQQTVATKELTAAEKERREDEMASIFAKAESDKGLYETTAATKSLTTAIVEQKEVSDPWAQAMVGAVERIDAAFADAWRNIGDGWGGLLDGMKDALSQWLAEMAHMLITKPLIAQLSAGFTGGGTGGIGGASNLLSLGKTGMSWLTGAGGTGFGLGASVGNAYGYMGDAFSALGLKGPANAAMNQSFGYSGATGFEAARGIGTNLVAGYAGSQLTASLYGGRESTGYGSVVGGTLGSIYGPIGTFVGSAVGEALDRALSGSDFSGKRVKLGVMTGSSAAGLEGSRTLASGLQIGNITRRAGDAGLSDEQIQSYLGAFDTLDATLTQIARGAGANVDFSKIALAGMPQSYDGGTSGQAFFGSLAKGELRDTLTKAPDEFVRQWLVAIDDELSTRVKGILGDTAGKTAEELIGLFGFAVDIDRLLSIDVIKAAQDSAESASRTIMDAYDESTAALVDLAQQYDGTTGSMTALTDALAGQKEVAAVLAQQYQALEAQISGTFGSAIDYIRESVMSDEALYQQRRDQILYLTNALTGATDPAQIGRAVSMIDSLSRDAYGRLSPEQQQGMAAEFVSFLEQAQQLAQSRVDAGQDSLAAREKAVQEAVNLEVMSGAAQVQQAAANTFAGAVAQFTAVVGSLQSEVNV